MIRIFNDNEVKQGEYPKSFVVGYLYKRPNRTIIGPLSNANNAGAHPNILGHITDETL